METANSINDRDTKSHRRRWTYLIAALFGVGVLTLTGVGVYAGLTATATGTQNVSSGTLSLTLSPESPSLGFGQTISYMAPGDQYNVYVDLTNGGTLAATGLTLGVTGTGSNLLTDATRGLAVAIKGCSVAWTVTINPAPGSGSCSGTTTPIMALTPVATLSGTPGAIAATMGVGQALHLQVNLTLPDQNENTLNGVLPSSTIQGLSTVLTYSFNEAQRTAQTTNS